jgi:hypothetical protein
MKRVVLMALLAAVMAACGGARGAGREVRYRARKEIVEIPAADLDIAGRVRGSSIFGAGAPAAPEPRSEPPRPTVSAGGSQSFQTALLVGVADFIVSRAKAELLNYVFEDFGKRLCTIQDGWDVASYFQETCRLILAEDGTRRASFRELGVLFRSALARDAAALLPIVLNAGLDLALPEELRPYRPSARFVVDVLYGFRAGEDPLGLLVTSGATLECDPEQPQSCPFRLLAVLVGAVVTTGEGDEVAWTDLDEQPEDRQRFLGEARGRLARALDANPELKEWLRGSLARKKQKEDKEKAPASRTSEPSTSRSLAAEILGDAGGVLDDLREVRAAFERLAGVDSAGLVPPEAIDATLALVRRVALVAGADEAVRVVDRVTGQWRKFEEWVGMGRAVLALIEGLWRGEDAVGLSVSAVRITPCAGDDDVGCGFRVVGLALRSLALAEKSWRTSHNGKVSDVGWDAILVDGERAFQEIFANGEEGLAGIAGDEAGRLLGWYQAHLEGANSARRQLLQRLQGALYRLRKIEQTVEGMGLTDVEARRAGAYELVEAALDLWRVGVTAVLSREEQKRALAILDNIRAARLAVKNGDIDNFLVSIYSLAREIGVEEPLPPSMRKYLPLVVDLLSAKDSADVSTALERYSDDVGGWRMKRDRSAGVSVNAFLGVLAGNERVKETNGIGFGGFAPIGVDLNLKRHGFFVSVLDLGTIITFRLPVEGEDMDAQPPELSFDHVISPGIFYRYSIHGPLVAGVGASAVRGLRGSVPEGEDPDWVFRVSAFFAVDLTIMSF